MKTQDAMIGIGRTIPGPDNEVRSIKADNLSTEQQFPHLGRIKKLTHPTEGYDLHYDILHYEMAKENLQAVTSAQTVNLRILSDKYFERYRLKRSKSLNTKRTQALSKAVLAQFL